jgi:hypothetical protein
MARKLGGALGIIGAILLIVTLFVAYYTVSGTFNAGGTSFTLSESLYLNNKVVETGSGGGLSVSNSTTYSDAHLTNVGNLYTIVTYLTYGGIVLGLIGAILAFMGRGVGRIVLVLALILALVAPILLFAEQPSALNNDFKGSSGSGPQSSFIGSCSGTSCGTVPGAGSSNSSASWGPDVGWYLAIGAFVVFLIAVIAGGEGAPKPAPAPMMGGASGSSGGSMSGPSMGTSGSFTCSACGASFGSADELAAHNQSAHGGGS